MKCDYSKCAISPFCKIEHRRAQPWWKESIALNAKLEGCQIILIPIFWMSAVRLLDAHANNQISVLLTQHSQASIKLK